MVYGGFCTTNSKKIYDKLIAIRNNGVNAEPENARLELASELGLNLKPSDLHASIGLVNFYSDNYDLLLNKVDEFTENIENIALHRLQTVKKLLNINSEENIFFGNNIEKYYSEIN